MEINKNMWLVLRLLLIATLAGFWTPQGNAADSPARLVVGDTSIEERLQIPRNLEPGRYAVHCEASIRRTGLPGVVYCYLMEGPAPKSLIKSVTSAVRRARYVPAVRNGERIDVYAVLTVFVDTTFAEPMVLAVPNNGVERPRFGLLYTAPQRVLPMPSVWRPGGLDLNALGAEPDLLIWMQFQVDERGDVSDFKLDKITDAKSSAIQYLERDARETKFLPGYHEGKPTAMLYMEPYFSGN